MASEAPEDPTTESSTSAPSTGPPAESGEQSKKGAKKAAAKAAKEAEKAKKAAEREAAAKASSASASEDPAKDNYGERKRKVPGESTEAEVWLENLTEEHIGKSVKIRAFLQNSRAQGAKILFIVLRDGRATVQGVLAASPEGTPVSKQMVKWGNGVRLESFVRVQARVEKPIEPVKSCSISELELHIERFYVEALAPEQLGLPVATAARGVVGAVEGEEEEDGGVSKVTADLSLEEDKSAPITYLSTLLDNPVIRKRTPVDGAIARVRNEVQWLFQEYLRSKGFEKFESPGLIAAASEGGANVFSLPYFGKMAYLAQSPQFYKQIEIAGGRRRVYSVGPVYRAENSNTSRHMTEFTGLDLEMRIEEHYHEVRDILEGVLLHIFHGLEANCKADIELVRTIYPSEPFLLPPKDAPVRLDFAEAQELLRKEGPAEFKDVKDDEDMGTAQEKALGALIREKFKTDFYVLDKFPIDARPFYAMPDPENPKVTNAYDFMMRGQEILSGGQRLHLPEELVAGLQRLGMDPDQPGIKEYVDHFRAAGVPAHGGGGIGLDRVVAWYLQLPHVHLACAYPRTPKRLTP